MLRGQRQSQGMASRLAALSVLLLGTAPVDAAAPGPRSTRAARMLLAQSSDSFQGLGVRQAETFCMDGDQDACSLGQLATVACVQGGQAFVLFQARAVAVGGWLFCMLSMVHRGCNQGRLLRV